MLNKRHNSIITLTLLLALVGLSKPARAFLLAQSETQKVTFTVPEELPKNTQIRITASNSTNTVNEGLKESFTAKYPKAEVKVDTKSSDDALDDLLAGKTDLVSIGRNLTAEEKAKGLIAVPISREKIAIVVSKDNSYDESLTFSQFAQLFKGEITDWSEIGGDPGKIELVDLPESNDTRRSLPNYSVFQTGEFVTGSNAIEIDEDSTDAMAAKLGTSGIGYAVAGDVAERDDLKIVSMHQTQPDDPRYPFSQPFSLVYQGEPNEAIQAFIAYAITKEGQEKIAQRVGSTSMLVAETLASNPENSTAKTADDVVYSPEASEVKTVDEVAQADIEDSGQINSDIEDSGKVDAELENSGEVDSQLKDSGEATSEGNESGEINPEFQDSGEVNTNIKDSGEPQSKSNTDAAAESDVVALDGEAGANGETGEANKGNADSANSNADVDAAAENDVAALDSEAGEANEGNADGANSDTDVDTAAESDVAALDSEAGADGEVSETAQANTDTATPADAEVDADAVTDTEAGQNTAFQDGKNILWWLPLIIGLPLLGVLAYRFAGGKGDNERSDREPALANVPNPNSPQGGLDTFDPDLDGGDATVGAGLGNTAAGNLETSSIGSTAIAAGGATMAGGTVAANNLANNVGSIASNEVDVDTDAEKDLEQVELENLVAQPETDLDIPVEEIPSDSVSEFTSQETKLQSSEQPTKLQTDTVSDTEETSPELFDNLSSIGGVAAVGGAAAASGYLDSKEDTDSVEEITETSTTDNDQDMQFGFVSEQSTKLQIDDVETLDDSELENATGEFEGDYILSEEDENTDVNNIEVPGDTDDLNLENALDDNESTSPTPVDLETVDTPELDLTDRQETSTDDGLSLVDGIAQAGGAAAVGGMAAASGFFTDSDSEQQEELDSVVSDAETDTSTEETADNLSWIDSLKEDAATQTNQSVDLEIADTPELDLSNDTDATVDQVSDSNEGLTQVGGAAAAVGGIAAASGFFTDSDSEQITEADGADIENIAGNINELNTSEVSTNNTLEEITFDNTTSSTEELNLGEITFDDTSSSSETSLEEITFDDTPSSSETSLEEITFDDTPISSETNLEEITFDNADGSNASLEEITFDNALNSSKTNLEELVFEDMPDSDKINLEEITFDDADNNSIDNLIDSINVNVADKQEINLDELGFKTQNLDDDDSESDAASNQTVEDHSQDMNNISEWLDSLEMPNQNTDNISEWLDNLSSDNSEMPENQTINNETVESENELEEISFQFLEDLLERDLNANQDNKQ